MQFLHGPRLAMKAGVNRAGTRAPAAVERSTDVPSPHIDDNAFPAAPRGGTLPGAAEKKVVATLFPPLQSLAPLRLRSHE